MAFLQAMVNGINDVSGTGTGQVRDGDACRVRARFSLREYMHVVSRGSRVLTESHAGFSKLQTSMAMEKVSWRRRRASRHDDDDGAKGLMSR